MNHVRGGYEPCEGIEFYRGFKHKASGRFAPHFYTNFFFCLVDGVPQMQLILYFDLEKNCNRFYI